MREPLKKYSLIVDGSSLALALKDGPELLREVGSMCATVLACRLSPLQKSEVNFKTRNFLKINLFSWKGCQTNERSGRFTDDCCYRRWSE